MNDYFDNWTIQLRKGLLEIGILSALKGRERYGYDLVKSLVEVPGLGVTEGTVCSPALLPAKTRLDRRPVGGVQRRPRPQILHFNPEGQRVMETMEAHLDVLLKGYGHIEGERRLV